MSARTWFLAGPIHGRTHRSAPTRWGRRSETNGNWRGTMPFPAGRDGARPLQENGSRPAHGGVRSPRPTDASQVVPSNGPPGRRALRMVAESRRDCPGQRRTAERLRRGREGWVEVGAEITPKGAINLGQSLSHGEAVTAPFAQGSLGTGDADCRVGPLGLLAMTMVSCHSEERSDVGIRSFLRCTMGEGSGRRGRRPLRKIYRSSSNGPMWASAPTERNGSPRDCQGSA